MEAFEREERDLEERYENGEITGKELGRELSELYRDARAAQEEEAQSAYDDVMNRW